MRLRRNHVEPSSRETGNKKDYPRQPKGDVGDGHRIRCKCLIFSKDEEVRWEVVLWLAKEEIMSSN